VAPAVARPRRRPPLLAGRALPGHRPPGRDPLVPPQPLRPGRPRPAGRSGHGRAGLPGRRAADVAVRRRLPRRGRGGGVHGVALGPGGGGPPPGRHRDDRGAQHHVPFGGRQPADLGGAHPRPGAPRCVPVSEVRVVPPGRWRPGAVPPGRLGALRPLERARWGHPAADLPVRPPGHGGGASRRLPGQDPPDRPAVPGLDRSGPERARGWCRARGRGRRRRPGRGGRSARLPGAGGLHLRLRRAPDAGRTARVRRPEAVRDPRLLEWMYGPIGAGR
jgi:hypothetical protein